MPLLPTQTWGRNAAPQGAGGVAQQGSTGTELLCVQGGEDTSCSTQGPTKLPFSFFFFFFCAIAVSVCPASC